MKLQQRQWSFAGASIFQHPPVDSDIDRLPSSPVFIIAMKALQPCLAMASPEKVDHGTGV